MEVNELDEAKVERGKGRGSLFFLLDRDLLPKLWTLETVNRFNFVAAYLVLLAGTGIDHQLTKWSAKACEQHVGIGKPRAMHAIEELIGHGLIARTESSTRTKPQYRLPPLDRQAEPIFLPVQLITGFNGETPILRRIREAGDALLLRMLIDLYAQVDTDATYGVPISALRQNPSPSHPARKLFEAGANAVWSMDLGGGHGAGGEWCVTHKVKAKNNEDAWRFFWERINVLTKIGAIWFEPWVFDGDALDAEPLLPVDPTFHYPTQQSDAVSSMTRLAYDACVALAGERTYFIDRAEGDILIPLPAHHRAPEIRGVARMRVEPDSLGRRLSYAKRMERIEGYGAAFALLHDDALAGRYNRPLRPVQSEHRRPA